MALEGTDLAILSARIGVARIGASRLGFYPCEVEGTRSDEPGEYIWKEKKPPRTRWALESPCSSCPDHDKDLGGNVTVTTTTVAALTVVEASPANIIVRVTNNEGDATEFYFIAPWTDPATFGPLRDYAIYSDEEDSGTLAPGNYEIVAVFPVPDPGTYWHYSSAADTGETSDEEDTSGTITINLDASETVTVTFTATYIAP